MCADIIFPPGGLVSRTLKSDLEEHIGEINDVYQTDKEGGAMLGPLMLREAQSLQGRQKKKLKDGPSATHGALWIARTLDFVTTFMESVSKPENSKRAPVEIAREAYTAVLKPFHSFIVANIVSLALGYVPTREKLIEDLNLGNEETARLHLTATVAAMRPIVDQLYAWLRAHDLEFK